MRQNENCNRILCSVESSTPTEVKKPFTAINQKWTLHPYGGHCIKISSITALQIIQTFPKMPLRNKALIKGRGNEKAV